MVGGVAALAGAIVIGRVSASTVRMARSIPIPGHNIPMALLGTLSWPFGWFGFNPGSTLAGTDYRIVVVAVNTMMAGTAATLAVLVVMYARGQKPDPGMLANGLLAGLVAIHGRPAHSLIRSVL